MSTVITHFDGDPFLLNFWLRLYEKYWRGECDQVYLSLYYKPELISQTVIDFNNKLLEPFKEISVYRQPNWQIPEVANQFLLSQVKDDKVGMIESDGFIFEKGLVKKCFDDLNEYDIVAPNYPLINYGYIAGDLAVRGFMRCFFFGKMDFMNRTDKDLMPKHIPAGFKLPNVDHVTDRAFDLDCFGWLSAQLATLHPKILYTPANCLHVDTMDDSELYSAHGWLHVRQMMSSALGLGGGEYGFWTHADEGQLLKKVFALFNEDLPNSGAEPIFIKALAMRLLFHDVLKDKTQIQDFADEYLQMLLTFMDWYALPAERIYYLKGYFKGLFKL